MARSAITKGDLVRRVERALGVTHHRADRILNAVIAAVEDALRRRRTVTVTGFGTFSVRKRRPRRSISIGSGRAVTIPARTVAHFTPSPSLNRSLR